MPAITPEQLRDLSVKTVEDFFNHKTPLSVGLAKQASALELNSEQIQRGVESVNSIAYLKILQMTPDRTVEFPLCKYAEVIDNISTPAEAVGFLKAASAQEETTSEYKGRSVSELPEHVRQKYLVKEAAHNKMHIEKLETKASHVAEDLVKLARNLAEDESWMDKLASVTDKSTFTPLSILVSGSVQTYSPKEGLFKEAQLQDCVKLTDLYRNAHALSVELSQRSDLQKRAEEHIKQAFIGTLASGVGRAVGSAVGGAIKLPFKLAAKPVRSAYNKVADPIRRDAASDIAGATTPMRRAAANLKTSAKIGGAVTGKITNKAMIAGGVGFGASQYKPGTNKTTGQRVDVWDQLQS